MPGAKATGFYRKCGFSPDFEATGYRVSVVPIELPSNWRMLSRVPKAVVKRLPMRLGWVQGSSAHMWEICNRPLIVADEKQRHPCASRIDRQAYVQLRCLGRNKRPVVVAWAAPAIPCGELVRIAHALGARLGAAELSVWTRTGQIRGLKNLGIPRGKNSIWSMRI